MSSNPSVVLREQAEKSLRAAQNAQNARQEFGADPNAVRETNHYQAEYVQSFVEKWDELIKCSYIYLCAFVLSVLLQNRSASSTSARLGVAISPANN